MTSYDNHSTPAIKNVIAQAIQNHPMIPSSWLHVKRLSREELIEHINEMCNEFGVTPDEQGFLIRSVS